MKFVKYAFFALLAILTIAVSFAVYWFILPSAVSGGDIELGIGVSIAILWSLILFVIGGNLGYHIYTKYINPPQ